jgi:hypothetical protein
MNANEVVAEDFRMTARTGVGIENIIARNGDRHNNLSFCWSDYRPMACVCRALAK